MWADLLLAHISDTWIYQVLYVLQYFPASRQLLDAIRSREAINLQFELTLCELFYSRLSLACLRSQFIEEVI